ncbi:MAG: tetratricopeptide repeat protein [Archangiaceae bacterium]|nr:tetratricopeptide repeat protein [Archangiaceae bacterium]
MCFDENTLLDLAAERLGASQAAEVRSHLRACEMCAEVFATVSLGSGATPPPARRELPPGARLGRHQVVRVVGRGGMGIVYAAHDPLLERQVALKQLRPAASAKVREELLREARALAQLEHPHVVPVHEIEEVGDELFMVMDLVEGATLRQWLKAAEHPRDRVLEVMLAAGSALEAAHRAGLVHRDFKPDNVLVGARGEVKVTDFGLAVSSAAPAPSGPALAAGTPGYMAPEVRLTGVSDARSDQYAFAVTLAEALSGRRGDPPLSALPARTPRALRRLLERALQADPALRFASMGALLERLERVRQAPRRRRALLASAAASLCLAAALAWLGTRTVLRCRGAGELAAGTWSASRAEQVRQAFLATKEPSAPTAYTAVAQTIDAWLEQWVAMRTAACEAARVKGLESDGQLSLRNACLDRRLRQLGALVEVLSSADAKLIQRAGALGDALEPLTACADLSELDGRARMSDDPATRATLDAATATLDQVVALAAAGRYQQAHEVLAPLSARLAPTGYWPLIAEERHRSGLLESELGSSAKAEPMLREALAAADAGRDDRLRVRVLADLVWLLGYELSRYPEVPALVDAAEAVLRRLGPGADTRVEQVRLLQSRGLAEWGAGHLDDAIATFQRSLPLIDGLGERRARALDRSLNNLGSVLSQRGRYREGVAVFEQVIALRRETLGPKHFSVARLEANLAAALLGAGQREAARQHLDAALEVYQVTIGPDHVLTALAHLNRAILLEQLGRPADALTELEPALATMVARRGEKNPDVALVWNARATCLEDLGRLDEAAEAYSRALAIWSSPTPPHPSAALARHGLGRVELLRGHLDRAGALLAEALEGYQRDHSGVDADFASVHVDLAALELASKRPQGALEQLGLAQVKLDAAKDAVPGQVQFRAVLTRARALEALGQTAGVAHEVARAQALADAHLAPAPELAALARLTGARR